jgi:hypothetical protein
MNYSLLFQVLRGILIPLALNFDPSFHCACSEPLFSCNQLLLLQLISRRLWLPDTNRLAQLCLILLDIRTPCLKT